jgi:transcription elongation regulator 1
MPLLITDPRYVLLPSQTERETAFNEWCRDVSRASRLRKASSTAKPAIDLEATGVPSELGGMSKEEEKKRDREGYDALLRAEASSTRETWEDFRRKWKKDRRFFAFGRDDREREKVFRSWLKDLGERGSIDQGFFGFQ